MRVNLGDSPFACPRATLEGISAVASGVRLDAQILSRPVALSQTHDQVPCFTQLACVCVVYVCLSVSLLYTAMTKQVVMRVCHWWGFVLEI